MNNMESKTIQNIKKMPDSNLFMEIIRQINK